MRSCVLLITLAVLFAVNIFVFVSLLHTNPRELRVSVLNVGQGDSILIEGPTGLQVLVDGGAGNAVLRELGSALGPFDRSLDMIIETHPDQDHIGGLPAVFDRYQVAAFMEPGIFDDSAAATALETALRNESGVKRFIARRGQRLDLGDGAYADVLYPDRNPSSMDTNNGSVVLHVVYGKTSFMLTGDLPSPIEDWLAILDKGDGELPSDVLKAGHHGSKNSTDDVWLAAVAPSMVAISAGKDNPYGHPAPETISRIKKEGTQIYSTIDSKTLTFVSDGETVREQ
jgi:beta-lactamase superfamily II metal-dependent hydrolase